MYNENGLIIKTRKLTTREVKKKLRDFIDDISDGCGPEIEQMAEELKQYGDQFVDALSGNYAKGQGGQSMFRNNGEGFRNGGGFSHSSFRNGNGGGNGNGNGGGTNYREGQGGEFRDDVQMHGDTDWNEKEKQRQRENQQKMDELEAELKRLKMRMSGN